VKCGGEAKPARKARGPGGTFPGPLGPGGAWWNALWTEAPSGREAARGSPSTRGEDMAILLVRQFAEGGGGHLGGPLAGVSAPAR
jgi:hypothetical protein